jgi:DNA-binding GntR family transcriptional regulator
MGSRTMVEFTGRPAYLQIADDLRDRILSGHLTAGDKLPSESDLMRDYEVSRTVPKMAINVLRSEGLITSHPGKGSFVRAAREVRRLGSDRYQRRTDAAPPFASDAKAAGRTARWEHHSHEERASTVIAERLAIEPGDPVMVTDYRFFASDEPTQLSTSYEPLAITRGTPVELPEDGDILGVIARMDAIGQHVTEVTERVTTRAPRPHETEVLAIPAGVPVLCIVRTHYAGHTPLETADIVVPGDRYEITWRTPVD